ncbi:unnamed protein product [Ectocarpus sp. 6 AP-2014]
MRGQWSNDCGTRLHYVGLPHPHHHPAGLPTNRSVTLPSVMCPQGTRPRRVRFCSHPPFSPSAEFRGGVADHRAATGETGKENAWPGDGGMGVYIYMARAGFRDCEYQSWYVWSVFCLLGFPQGRALAGRGAGSSLLAMRLGRVFFFIRQ